MTVTEHIYKHTELKYDAQGSIFDQLELEIWSNFVLSV